MGLRISDAFADYRAMTEPQRFLIYQSEDGATRIDVMLEAETLWLSQKQLTELSGKAKGTVSEHIKHIFEDGELTPAATVRLFRTVQSEGGRDVSRPLQQPAEAPIGNQSRGGAVEPVPVPSSGLLSHFDRLIQPMLAQSKTLSFSTRKLGAARGLFLPRLMSGKIAV